MERKERIREFVQSNFFVSQPLGDSDSLLDQGIVDSTGILEVVAFLESEFGITVLDEEMLPENLDSIASIATYVQRKSDLQRKSA